MSYYMNFEIRLNAEKETEKIYEVAKKTLQEIGCDKCAEELYVRGNSVMDGTSYAIPGDNFGDTIKTIYTAIVKELPEVDFEIFSGYGWGSEDAGFHFIKKDTYAMADSVIYEGCGTCPECGEEIVFVDDYDPSKTYYCKNCEMEVDNTDLYDYFIKEEQIYEVVNGELIEK